MAKVCGHLCLPVSGALTRNLHPIIRNAINESFSQLNDLRQPAVSENRNTFDARIDE